MKTSHWIDRSLSPQSQANIGFPVAPELPCTVLPPSLPSSCSPTASPESSAISSRYETPEPTILYLRILIPLQKIPILGPYFIKEVHPADNVSFDLERACGLQLLIILLALLNELVDYG